MKYYNLTKILKKNATYNIIIGERSNGKTYSALLYSLECYFNDGSQVAVVRRWGEDVKGRRAKNIYTQLEVNNEIHKLSNGQYTHIHHYAGKFFPCTYDNEKLIYDNKKVLGYTFSLTEYEHNKSISFPHINNIIFDEFLTNRMYLPDEFVLFMNTISSLIRLRDTVKIFMLGNTVNKFCPYFKEMGLSNILKMEQGDIDVYRYGESKLKVVVEYCTSLKKYKKNNHYFAFNNPKLQMITSGAWELDIYPHLPIQFKKSDIINIYFIDFNDQVYQCEIVNFNNSYLTYIHIKTTSIKDSDKCLIYTLQSHYQLNYNVNILKPQNEPQERILWFFKTNRVFYQNNEVGDAINNYLKNCG